MLKHFIMEGGLNSEQRAKTLNINSFHINSFYGKIIYVFF